MGTLQLTEDFKEFLRLLNDHEVEYLIVGGYAAIYYGNIRTTGDIDFWVAINPKNAQRLSATLQAFGFSAENAREELFLDEKKILQFGRPPWRIDILMEVSGLGFTQSYRNRVSDTADGVPFNILSLEDFKKNKLASGRPKDLSDLDYFSGQ